MCTWPVPCLEKYYWDEWDIDGSADDFEGLSGPITHEPMTYVLPWREEILGPRKHHALEANDCDDSFDRRFYYAGPTIEAQHGEGEPELAHRCLTEVGNADLIFCWIDREDTIGSIAEIGAAYDRKPIFVAFASEQLATHFYFIQQLATVAVIAPDVMTAWRLFARWQT